MAARAAGAPRRQSETRDRRAARERSAGNLRPRQRIHRGPARLLEHRGRATATPEPTASKYFNLKRICFAGLQHPCASMAAAIRPQANTDAATGRPSMPKQEPRARSVLNLKIAIVAAAAAGAMLAAPQIADACTRILWNNNKLAVVVGRTMDWPESTEPILTMLPRGMSRDGGRAGPQVAVSDNPARWTSKYGKPGHLDLRHRHRRRIERARPRRAHALSAGDRFRPARPQQAGPASRPVGAILPWTTRRPCRRRSMCSTRSRSSR